MVLTPAKKAPKYRRVLLMMPMSSSSSSINSNSGMNSSTSSINNISSSNAKRSGSEDNLNFPGQWRFSQCFGDKTETLEVAEGMSQSRLF